MSFRPEEKRGREISKLEISRKNPPTLVDVEVDPYLTQKYFGQLSGVNTHTVNISLQGTCDPWLKLAIANPPFNWPSYDSNPNKQGVTLGSYIPSENQIILYLDALTFDKTRSKAKGCIVLATDEELSCYAEQTLKHELKHATRKFSEVLINDLINLASLRARAIAWIGFAIASGFVSVNENALLPELYRSLLSISLVGEFVSGVLVVNYLRKPWNHIKDYNRNPFEIEAQAAENSDYQGLIKVYAKPDLASKLGCANKSPGFL